MAPTFPLQFCTETDLVQKLNADVLVREHHVGWCTTVTLKAVFCDSRIWTVYIVHTMHHTHHRCLADMHIPHTF
jgi:hypothetical protein